jgi:hypothetical protein
VDHVGGVGRFQLWPQCSSAGERRGDTPLSLLALSGQVLEQCSRLCIGSSGPDEDAEGRRGACIDRDADGGETGEPVGCAQERADVGACGDGDGLAVSGDRRVEDGLESSVLR